MRWTEGPLAPLYAPSLYAAGWAVVHSIWMVLLIWFSHQLIQRFLRRWTSSVRYTAALAMLCGCLLGPAIAFWFAWPGMHSVSLEQVHKLLPAGLMKLPKAPAPPAWAAIAGAVSAAAPWIAVAWAVGLFWRAIGTIRQLRYIRQLKAGAKPFDTPSTWRALTKRLVARDEIPVLESDQIRSAATLGWLRPVILMPIGIVASLSPSEVEGILAHELAHIRRADFLANLIQACAESVLFFHPCVWAIGRDIRNLREECCDDLAVEAIGGDRKTFAKALAAADGYVPTLAMAASGGRLLDRVQRLRNQQLRPDQRNYARCAGSLFAVLFVFFVVSTAGVSHVAGAEEISAIGSHSLGESVYELLDAARPPGAIADAMQGVTKQSLKAMSDAQILDLAKVIAGGGMPEELDFACHQREWRGGNFWVWESAAKRMFVQAAGADPRDARTLARAATLLAAQDQETPGAMVFQMIVTSPKFQQLSGVDTETWNGLMLINAVCVERGSFALKRVVAWEKAGTGEVTPELQFLAQVDAYTRLAVTRVVHGEKSGIEIERE